MTPLRKNTPEPPSKLQHNSSDFHKYFVSAARIHGLEPVSNDLPPWIDRQLIHEGQAFIEKYFFSIFFAHLVSLIFLLCYIPVQKLLYRTGRSDTNDKALKRYMSTLVHIKRWYEGDLLDPLSPARKDINRIQVLHAGVASKYNNNKPIIQLLSVGQNSSIKDAESEPQLIIELHESLRTIDDDESREYDVILHEAKAQIPTISQLDMAVTQFCFMGLITLFPVMFGVPNCKGLQGFIHVWALIGYCLGISDKYNICLPENSEAKSLIFNQILLKDFKNSSTKTHHLWKSLISGISKFVPFLSLPAVLTYIVQGLFNVRSSINLSSYDRTCLKLMNYCFNSWIHQKILLKLLNFLLRLAIFLTFYRLKSLDIISKNTKTTTIRMRTQQSLLCNNNNNHHQRLRDDTTDHPINNNKCKSCKRKK